MPRGGSQAGIRLPFDPLDTALALRGVDVNRLDPRHLRAVWKARNKGFISLAMADEICCTVLTVHPHEVWGQEYEDKVWFDMHDDDESGVDAAVTPSNVVQFPTFAQHDAAMAVAA